MPIVKQSFISNIIGGESYKQFTEYAKVIVAVGTCACTGGIFKECYNILGGVDTVLPVDIYVPGCAARPQAIIDGLVKAIDLFEKRSDEHDELVRRQKHERGTKAHGSSH